MTQPLPGTETKLTWQLGSRPKPHPKMRLTLTDVSGFNIDALAAKLRTGTITVVSDGSTRVTISRLIRGTLVLEHGRRVATANRRGVASVKLGAGTTVLKLVQPARARKRRARPLPRPPRRTAGFTG